MTGNEALKLVWDQIGKSLEGHAKFLLQTVSNLRQLKM